MVNILPIPPQLLPHQFDYFEKNGKGRYGAKFKDGVSIRRARISLEKKIIVNQQAKSIELSGDLYIDAKNTKPFIELVPDSYIVWNGEKLRVNAVTGVYDSDKLHHYKIKLSNWS